MWWSSNTVEYKYSWIAIPRKYPEIYLLTVPLRKAAYFQKKNVKGNLDVFQHPVGLNMFYMKKMPPRLLLGIILDVFRSTLWKTITFMEILRAVFLKSIFL